MFRRSQFVTTCLLGTLRSLFGTSNSKRKNLGETVYRCLLSEPFCMLRCTRGAQTEHYISEPKNSKYVSQKTLKRPFTVSIQYSDTSFSDHFIMRDWVSNKCILPENCTDKHSSVYKWRTDLNNRNKTGGTSFTKAYELSKGLWTSHQERWRHPGPLKSQMCCLHRRVPQQAAFEHYLSATNEERCRRHLQSNTALYENERKKSSAAVLVSLCTVRGEPAFLFTLRSSKLRGKHKGDVSFAGGKKDPSDRTIVETALREAREELGINVTDNDVWGVLKPLNDSSGMMIAPVLANLGPLETLPLRPNPSEVEDIFTLTVAHLCNPQNRGYTHFRTGNRYGYTLPVFHSDKYRIWGLTAVALDHTLKLIMPV